MFKGLALPLLVCVAITDWSNHHQLFPEWSSWTFLTRVSCPREGDGKIVPCNWGDCSYFHCFSVWSRWHSTYFCFHVIAPFSTWFYLGDRWLLSSFPGPSFVFLIPSTVHAQKGESQKKKGGGTPGWLSQLGLGRDLRGVRLRPHIGLTLSVKSAWGSPSPSAPPPTCVHVRSLSLSLSLKKKIPNHLSYWKDNSSRLHTGARRGEHFCTLPRGGLTARTPSNQGPKVQCPRWVVLHVPTQIQRVAEDW